MANAAVIGNCHVLSDMAVKEVQLLDSALRILHSPLGGLNPASDPPICIYHAMFQPTLQPLDPPLLRIDALLEVANLGLDPIDGVLVCPTPEGYDVFVV